MTGILLFASTAMAWQHTGNLWNRDYFPLNWYISDYRSEVLPEDYQLQVIETSYDNWVIDAPCAQLTHEFSGIREGHHVTGRDSSDGKNTFYYDDPNDEQGSGVLGVTYTVSTGEVAFNRDGQTYRYSYDSDIVFSKDVGWIATTDMDASCSGTPIEAVATHEIGHQWGMGHSCEENEVTAGLCEDVELRTANMFWAAPACSSFDAEEVFTDDDIEGMTGLYGPYASFEASTATYGGVPLEVCFSLSSTSAIKCVEWLYGDSESDAVGDCEGSDTLDQADYEICHTYEEKGQYTVNVTIRGESDDCPDQDWEYTDRERAMVVACEPPQAAEGFSGMFTYAPDEGLIYQMYNQADTTVYGCIDRVQWDVFKGDSLVKSVSAWSPKIEFPEEGDYRIVLNLGGPGGFSAEELNITVEETAAGGCAVVSATSGMAGVLAVFGIALRRRED